MRYSYNFHNFIFTVLILVFSKSFSQSTAIYDFTFSSVWNAADHTSIPANAHWSDLVGATHNMANEFLEVGQLATNGIKDVAELGLNTNFHAEVNNAIASNRADIWLQQSFAPYGAISSATLSHVEFSEDFPLITLVSMVAPSPDWFIAINSLNLRTMDNMSWKSSFSIDVFVYDSGTDDGLNYEASNSVTNPPDVISKIEGAPFNGNVIGTLTITLKSVLNNKKNDFDGVSIYPNPSDGKIIISNPNTIYLEHIEVYNVIGKLVEILRPGPDSFPVSLDLSTFKKGMYFLRLYKTNGRSLTQKLVLQ